MVEVTSVKVVPIRGEGATRAMASVTLNDSFVIHGVRVLEGENGLFVGMPRQKDSEGNFRDIAHPVTAEARALVASQVLEEYQRAMERGDRPKEVRSRSRD
jgi:stage V sporulation protein G